MSLSRLERFKAAMQADLDRIPDKPKAKEVEVPTPPSETDQTASRASSQASLENADTDSSKTSDDGSSTVKSGQATATASAFNRLKLTATAHAEDSDDSESGCPIEIEEVLEEEPVHKVTSNDSSSKQATPELGPQLRRKQVTMAGELFCPILAIMKYPYKYVPKADAQNVASAFFDKGQFWAREWDLFYVWQIEGNSERPIIFVREEQFAQLLKEVGAKFRHMYIDPKETWFRQIKLVTSFPDHPRLLPRYLGRCKSRDDYDEMVASSPAKSPFDFPKDEPEPARPASKEQIDDFNDITETALVLARNKGTASKDKKLEQRLLNQATLSKQLKRAQRYFGVRKMPVKNPDDPMVNVLPPLDITRPPPYELEEDVVIVCVDIEAWERSHSIITEIGVATLDTRDIKDLPPGPLGENWRSKIRARHFRIREHMMYENHLYVQGNADRFEKDFGTTEIINRNEACHVVASCFKEPFSKPFTQQDIDDSWQNLSKTSGERTIEEKRNIIFLGHNPEADITYLKKLGYDTKNLLNLRETLDTAGLYKAHKRVNEARSVGNILSDFGLVGWNLHNAGNDAVYTLWIMLATIVAEAQARGKEPDKAEADDDDSKNGKVGAENMPNGSDDRTPKPAVKEKEIIVAEENKVW